MSEMSVTNHLKPSGVVTRYYNYLAFNGDSVIKGAPAERYVRETKWFKEAEVRISGNVPKIINYDKSVNLSEKREGMKFYEMEAIKGENLYQRMIKSKQNMNEDIPNLISLTKKMHSQSLPVRKEDIFQMYYVKPLNALIDFIRETGIETSSFYINGKKYSDPVQQLTNTYSRLESSLMNTRYSFIHGDLTMSNTMRGVDGKLYLIDPRGGFGSTELFGDVRYDVAKIFYSVIGNFDSLNNGRFEYSAETDKPNAHLYSIQNSGLSQLKEQILGGFEEDEQVISYIHSTIWLSLIPHVANNKKQQFCTYCHGVYLLNQSAKYEAE